MCSMTWYYIVTQQSSHSYESYDIMYETGTMNWSLKSYTISGGIWKLWDGQGNFRWQVAAAAATLSTHTQRNAINQRAGGGGAAQSSGPDFNSSLAIIAWPGQGRGHIHADSDTGSRKEPAADVLRVGSLRITSMPGSSVAGQGCGIWVWALVDRDSPAMPFTLPASVTVVEWIFESAGPGQ